MNELIPAAVLLLAFSLFAFRRLRVFLHIFQQEEYDSGRFVPWLARRRAFDRKGSAAILAGTGIALAVPWDAAPLAGWFVAAAGLFLGFLTEPDPRREAKKALVLTPRAQRLLWTSWSILVLVGLLLAAARVPLWWWVLPVQAAPLAMAAASLLLRGFESRNNRRYVAEARAKLERLDPVRIGITGSFGKTSVKHMLGHVLEMQAPTLITPGSVNTELGITRIVREKLTERHQFFVCEMGAYGIGSIDRLCRLVAPNLGIITAIGAAHYERFKSLEVVAQAKYELAWATAAVGGKLIVAQPALDYPAAQAFLRQHRDRCVIVGESEGADIRVEAVVQTKAGLELRLRSRASAHAVHLPLFGQHHAMNAALAFAAAVELGMPADDVAVALASVGQIKHRSEVKKHARGGTLIDDAYNSNPKGFASGLELLDILSSEDGRRILVSPGIVELGDAHEREHAELAKIAARTVDVFLPIVPERIEGFIAGYAAERPDGQVVRCETVAEAWKWLDSNLTPADVVLIENDLPDLYEARLSL